jgi:hypothetical protein
LQGQLSIARAGVFELDVAFCMFLNPSKIFVTVRRIDTDQKMFGLDSVKNNVIYDPALFVHQEIVLGLLQFDPRNVIG